VTYLVQLLHGINKVPCELLGKARASLVATKLLMTFGYQDTKEVNKFKENKSLSMFP